MNPLDGRPIQRNRSRRYKHDEVSHPYKRISINHHQEELKISVSQNENL